MGYCEDGIIRNKCDNGTGFVWFSGFFHVIKRFAKFILLLKNFSFAIYSCFKMWWEGIHAGYTNSVQSPWNFIGSLVKFAAGMQYGHNHFQGRPVFFLVHACGDATAVISYSDGIIFVDDHFYLIAKSCQCLIYGVVYHFIHQVV